MKEDKVDWGRDFSPTFSMLGLTAPEVMPIEALELVLPVLVKVGK